MLLDNLAHWKFFNNTSRKDCWDHTGLFRNDSLSDRTAAGGEGMEPDCRHSDWNHWGGPERSYQTERQRERVTLTCQCGSAWLRTHESCPYPPWAPGRLCQASIWLLTHTFVAQLVNFPLIAFMAASVITKTTFSGEDHSYEAGYDGITDMWLHASSQSSSVSGG